MRGAVRALFETSFADALLSTDQPIPYGIAADNAAVPARRFAVYRNNVVVGLGKALKSRFPVVEKIVGEEFFAAMARVFVKEQPPRSPLLAAYGDDFPAFIAAFEPASGLPSQELASIDNWRGEDALVSRPYLEVEVRALPPGGAAFLLTLAAGRPLDESAEAALADDPDFDLTGNLAGLIGSGLVRGIVFPQPKKYRQP
jgi:hypothetical protein